MPYLFRGDPNLSGRRGFRHLVKGVRARKAGLGQEWVDSTGYSYLRLKIVDKNGNKVAAKKFYIDIDPLTKGMYDTGHHASHVTDENGELKVSIYNSGKTEQRQVSVTPLFGSPFAPQDQAIVWKRTMTIGKNPDLVTVVLEPGGGFEKSQPSVPSPTPAPAPVNPSAPSAQLPAPVPTRPPVVDDEFPWTLVAVGGAALIVGIYVLPMIFGEADAR